MTTTKIYSLLTGTIALLILSGSVFTYAEALYPQEVPNGPLPSVPQRELPKQDRVLVEPVSVQPSPVEAFRQMIPIGKTATLVPTVVEVPISGVFIEYKQFAVTEVETNTFISHHFTEEYKKQPVVISATSVHTTRASSLVDADRDSSVDFLLPEDGVGTAEIILTSNEAIRSSSMVFDFAQNVSLPTYIAVYAVLGSGTEERIVARKRMTGRTVTFPKTSAQQWRIVLTYAQPLRINEINLVQDDVEAEVVRGLRFLAQPNMLYVVYLNPDKAVRIRTTEGGDLREDEGVKMSQTIAPIQNPLYKEADSDSDGVRDIIDNCVQVINADQADVDGNGRGDACEDFDRDGVMNQIDNCPDQPNRSQRDEDNDGIGDVCDDEESRLTEKYAWIPWAGLGFAGFVLVILFVIVAKRPMRKEGEGEAEAMPTEHQEG